MYGLGFKVLVNDWEESTCKTASVSRLRLKRFGFEELGSATLDTARSPNQGTQNGSKGGSGPCHAHYCNPIGTGGGHASNSRFVI